MARWFVAGGDGNWGNTNNWSSIGTGGASGAAVPVAADDVIFDTLSGPSMTVNASARACRGIDASAYTGALVMSQQLTIGAGGMILGASMSLSGTALLLCSTSSTWQSNGTAWPGPVTWNNLITITLNDNWNIDGLLTLGSSSNNLTLSGAFTVFCGAGLTIATSGTVTGATIVMDGTGTVTNSGAINSLFKIDNSGAGGNTTFASGNTFRYRGTGAGFAYVSGTATTTNSTLACDVAATLDLGGMTWTGPVALSANATITLNSALNVSGLLSLGNAGNNLVIGGSGVINASGGVRHVGASGVISGNQINMTATSTIDGPSITTGRIDNPINLNAPGGAVTFGATSTPYLQFSDVTYTAGNIVIDGTEFTPVGGSVGGGPMNSMVVICP